MTAEYRRHQVCIALERHMIELDFGDFADLLHKQMRRSASASRAVVDFARLLARGLNVFSKCFVRRITLHHKAKGVARHADDEADLNRYNRG